MISHIVLVLIVNKPLTSRPPLAFDQLRLKGKNNFIKVSYPPFLYFVASPSCLLVVVCEYANVYLKCVQTLRLGTQACG